MGICIGYYQYYDLNELAYILELSSILIKGALEENNVELIYEGFFQIESRLKKANLVNENIYKAYKRKFTKFP